MNMQNESDLNQYMYSRYLKDSTRNNYITIFDEVAELMEYDIIFKRINIIEFRELFNCIQLSRPKKYKFLSILNRVRPNEVIITKMIEFYRVKR